ncbi:dynein light chain 1, cytoplasmic-like [Molossus molossus]|uniref:dynein light chain 1, cytoplasmic-like n=1 Tax=Molossus molossus TaxID=27622 RepID=UPI00174704FB|nr:dynein light chain 1, cytoplasmic-like [Molossus molossus]
MCDRKAVIKNAGMSEMGQDSVKCAPQALENCNTEDTAAHIRELDLQYHSAWCCVVGRSVSDAVTHETSSASASIWAK